MLREELDRREISVTFPRPVVEFDGDLGASCLSQPAHRSSLSDVLANEPIGVLVRGSLP